MRINIGFTLIFFAVVLYIAAFVYDLDNTISYLLIGVGISQLNNYWEVFNKNEKKG